MGARLVQLDEDGERVATIRLGPREIVIGRDAAEADLVVEDTTRVSRRHAAVRAVASGWELADLGSANGTTLNGEPIERALLEDGDSIRLGGDVEFLFEIARGGGAIALVALVLLLGAGASAGYWWWSQTRPNPVMAQAARLANEAVLAVEAGNPEMAKERFRSAAGLMFREGLLDDVERDRIMRTAMERIEAELGTDVDLWKVFRQTMQALAKKRQEEERRAAQAPPTPGAPSSSATVPTCRLDAVAAAGYEACLQQWIRHILRELRQTRDELPKDFVSLIAERQCVEHGFIKRSIERGRPVVPMMCAELEKKYLPKLTHYLSLIESGYQTGALSTASAYGPWQFIPETGRRYGLKVTPGGDERADFGKSTVAAAEYLNDLLFDFGGDDLLLALASYNRGEQGVRNALRKLENPFSERSYWRLVETGKLPKETACYVSRFLAAATAGEGGLPDPAVVNAYLGRQCSNRTCYE